MIRFSTVRWKNFLSYGDRWTEFKLDAGDLTIITGKNGAGKSTVLDAIVYCLFGKPYRNVSKDQLVNSVNGKDCKVEVEFTTQGAHYRVLRGIKPSMFEVHRDGVLLNQDAKKRDYQKVLERQVLRHNYASFTQLIVLGSATWKPFMQLKPSERRKVIEDVLDISVYSLMAEELKEKLSIVREKIRTLTSQRDLHAEAVTRQQRHVDVLTKSQEDHTAEREAAAKVKDKELEDLSTRKTYLESILPKLREGERRYRETFQEQNSTAGALTSAQRLIAPVEKDIKFFEHLDECPSCKQKLSEAARKSVLNNLRSELKLRTGEIEDIQSRLKELNAKLTKYEPFEVKLGAANQELAHIDYTIGRLNHETAELRLVVEKKETPVGDAEAELKTLVERSEKTVADLRKVSARSAYFTELLAMLSDDGIKSKVIKTYIPLINKLVSRFLTKFGFQVSYELDEKFVEKIKSRYRDEFTYESFSEGEKLRIDLALLMTWREIAKLKASTDANVIVFDEVLDRSLDDDGAEAIVGILKGMIDSGTSGFVISHKGSFKSSFDRALQAVKVGNFSTIQEEVQ